MKRHLATLAVLLVSTLTFAQQGGIYNFTVPYGPPAQANTIILNQLFVNQINLLTGTSVSISGVNFYAYSAGQNAVMTGCVYADLFSPPVWQDSVKILAPGPLMLNAPPVVMTGNFYWAFVETGTRIALVQGFATSGFAAMENLYNLDTIRWGTSASYVGSGCPSSLYPLSPAPASINMPAFFLHP